MPQVDITNALSSQECKQEVTDLPPPAPLSKELAEILRAAGVQTCVSGSSSYCASYDSQVAGGFVAANAKICQGTDFARGCEAIAVNYQKTTDVKRNIVCAIKQSIQQQTQEFQQLNNINISFNSCKS